MQEDGIKCKLHKVLKKVKCKLKDFSIPQKWPQVSSCYQYKRIQGIFFPCTFPEKCTREQDSENQDDLKKNKQTNKKLS